MADAKPPELGADLSDLTDEQIIAWYSHHPNPTVRSLVSRLAWSHEDHKRAVMEAFENGLGMGQKRRPHNLSANELVYAASIGVMFDE